MRRSEENAGCHAFVVFREVSHRHMDRRANQVRHVKVRYCPEEVSHSESKRIVPVSLTTESCRCHFYAQTP